MSAAKERLAIGQLFNANWDSDTTPVSWPNKDIDPPENGNWVKVAIQAADARNIEFGGQVTHKQTVGLILIQVHVPVNTGDGEALDLAESAAAIFRGQRVTLEGGNGSVLFREPTIREVGSDAQGREGGAYFQVNVSVPYQRGNI